MKNKVGCRVKELLDFSSDSEATSRYTQLIYASNSSGHKLIPVQSDFVLLPCDLAPPKSLKLSSVLDKHRSCPQAVLTSVFYEPVESVKEGASRPTECDHERPS